MPWRSVQREPCQQRSSTSDGRASEQAWFIALKCAHSSKIKGLVECNHLSRRALSLVLSAPHCLLGIEDGARLGVALGRAQRDFAHACPKAQRADRLPMAALLQMSSPWKSEPCLCSSALPPSKTQQ